MHEIAIIGSAANDGTIGLVEGWRSLGLDARLVPPADAVRLSPETVVIGRLDVLPSLDGVEEGLLDLLMLERRGLDVRNPVHALLGAHDKLRTARLLAAAGVPHPRTRHVRPGEPVVFEGPVVLKPRFGSWGRDVCLCATEADLLAYLHAARAKPWYRRQGMLLQEEVTGVGHDLRVLVAAGRVIGSVERIPAPGEWRTNISCGGSSQPALPSADAAELAATAAVAIDADFVGVDMLRLGGDRYVVLELNGAIDFDRSYSFPGEDVYAAAAHALGFSAARTSPVALRGFSDARTAVWSHV